MKELCIYCGSIFEAKKWSDHGFMKCEICNEKEIKPPLKCSTCKQIYRIKSSVATCGCFVDAASSFSTDTKTTNYARSAKLTHHLITMGQQWIYTGSTPTASS